MVSSQVRPCPSPRAWWGFSQGLAHFVTIAPSVVFATGGVEAMSLASMAQVTCLMSSLTGMFERNLVPSLVAGSAKPSGGVSLFLDLPSNIFPHSGDSMGSARGWIELEGSDDPIRLYAGWAKAAEAHLRFLPWLLFDVRRPWALRRPAFEPRSVDLGWSSSSPRAPAHGRDSVKGRLIL